MQLLSKTGSTANLNLSERRWVKFTPAQVKYYKTVSSRAERRAAKKLVQMEVDALINQDTSIDLAIEVDMIKREWYSFDIPDSLLVWDYDPDIGWYPNGWDWYAVEQAFLQFIKPRKYSEEALKIWKTL